MYPILGRIGSHVVFSYTVAIVAGMFAGLWAARQLAKTRMPNPDVVLDAGFWALLGGMAGGRIGYVGANWAYYAEHVDKALNLREGGLFWHGALIGGCAAMIAWWAVRSRSNAPLPGWRELFDVLAPGAALGGAVGWLGCLLTGSAYGAEAGGYGPPISWLTADLPDIYGVSAVRFMTQPLMASGCLLLAGLLWWSYKRLPRGLPFALYLFAYAAADFGVAFMRGDGMWHLGLGLSQWIALAEVVSAAALGVSAWIGRDRGTSQL
jgi:phosphatidylglycerol:prolipoprotein diacylglycerol transferase